MEIIHPYKVDDDGKLHKKFLIRTYVARSENRKLIIRWPGPTEYITDMRSDNAAQLAVKHIREHGVDCSIDAMNRLLNNF